MRGEAPTQFGKIAVPVGRDDLVTSRKEVCVSARSGGVPVSAVIFTSAFH